MNDERPTEKDDQATPPDEPVATAADAPPDPKTKVDDDPGPDPGRYSIRGHPDPGFLHAPPSSSCPRPSWGRLSTGSGQL